MVSKYKPRGGEGVGLLVPEVSTRKGKGKKEGRIKNRE